MMRLELPGGLAIRSYRPDDAAALVRHANNRNVSRHLRDRFPHPYTPRAADGWLRHVAAQDPETGFAIASTEELIGGIGIELGDDVYRRSAEIGFWLGEAHWGRGIASAAVSAFTFWAIEHFDLLRIWGCVFETNPASARVLEKAGYRLEGRMRSAVIKEGRAQDELIYGFVRE